MALGTRSYVKGVLLTEVCYCSRLYGMYIYTWTPVLYFDPFWKIESTVPRTFMDGPLLYVCTLQFCFRSERPHFMVVSCLVAWFFSRLLRLYIEAWKDVLCWMRLDLFLGFTTLKLPTEGFSTSFLFNKKKKNVCCRLGYKWILEFWVCFS